MPRVCEICGRAEADESEAPEVTNAIELLYVCEGCREERQPPEDRSL